MNVFFQGVNKYLLLLLILFIGLIGFLIYSKPSNPTGALPTTRNQPRPRVSLTPIKDLVAKNTKDYPMNKIMYESVKGQLLPGEKIISEGRMHGKVLQSEITANSVSFYLESLLPNMFGSKIWFVYGPETLDKIKVQKGVSEKTPARLGQITPGSEVYIDENIDYSSSYPASILGVTITIL